MGLQQQMQQTQKPQGRKRFPLGLRITIAIICILIIAFVIAAIIIVKNQGINQSSAILTIVAAVATVVFGATGILIAISAWRYPVTPVHPEAHSASPPAPAPSPQIIVQSPLLPLQ